MTEAQAAKLRAHVERRLEDDMRDNPEHWAAHVAARMDLEALTDYLDLGNRCRESVEVTLGELGFDPRGLRLPDTRTEYAKVSWSPGALEELLRGWLGDDREFTPEQLRHLLRSCEARLAEDVREEGDERLLAMAGRMLLDGEFPPGTPRTDRQRCNWCDSVFDLAHDKCPKCGRADALMWPFETGNSDDELQ
jgi:hypothetical protein